MRLKRLLRPILTLTACVVAGGLAGLGGRIILYSLVGRTLSPVTTEARWLSLLEMLHHDDEIRRVSVWAGLALGIALGAIVLRLSRKDESWRPVHFGIVVLAAVWIVLFDFKATALIALGFAVILHLRYLAALTAKSSVARAWWTFVFLSVLPLDLSVANFPGPPRFVPLESCGGDYGPEGLAALKRGEFMIDGLMGVCGRVIPGGWIFVW